MQTQMRGGRKPNRTWRKYMNIFKDIIQMASMAKAVKAQIQDMEDLINLLNTRAKQLKEENTLLKKEIKNLNQLLHGK